MSLPALETERLSLQPFTAEDVDAYYQLYWQIADQAPQEHPNRADLHAENEHYLSYGNYGALQPFGRWLVLSKTNNSIIGTAILIPYRFQPEQIEACHGRLSGYEVIIGWAFAAAYRRQGYATEAARAIVAYGMQTLRLNRIIAWTEPDNIPSIGVMRKLGMTFIHNADAKQIFALIEK